MQLNHMSSPVALCSLTTKVALTFQQDKHRLSLQAFINHLDIYLLSSVTILFYSKLTVFYNYKKYTKPKESQWQAKLLFSFLILSILSPPLLSVWGTEPCYKSYELHLLRCVKWVFTAWLEGTCSQTCGDRR